MEPHTPIKFYFIKHPSADAIAWDVQSLLCSFTLSLALATEHQIKR